jgi:hypothetical protein
LPWTTEPTDRKKATLWFRSFPFGSMNLWTSVRAV